MERQNTSGSAHSSLTFPSLAPLLCSNFLSGHMQEMSLPQEMPDIPPQTSKVFAQLIQPIALNNTLSIDLCHQHVNIPPTSPPKKKSFPSPHMLPAPAPFLCLPFTVKLCPNVVYTCYYQFLTSHSPPKLLPVLFLPLHRSTETVLCKVTNGFHFAKSNGDFFSQPYHKR